MSLVFWRKFIPTTQPSSTWKAVSSWSLRKLLKSLSGRFKNVAHFQVTCWLKVKFSNQDGGPQCQDLPHLLLLNSSKPCGRLPDRIPGSVLSMPRASSAQARFAVHPGAPCSRALHLQGQAVPTVMRFSNASGDPDVHDGLANARALAVKFQLPDGKNADILALSIEGFPARTPEELLAFLRAQLPDPITGKPAPDAVPRFLESHPASRAFIERLMQKPVPASYGQASYYAEHAFKFTAADGTSRFGRYHWMPEAGEAYLSPEDASTRSPNFLREELESRLRNGPIVFRLLLQIAGQSDPTDDVATLWPADRPLVELGRSR